MPAKDCSFTYIIDFLTRMPLNTFLIIKIRLLMVLCYCCSALILYGQSDNKKQISIHYYINDKDSSFDNRQLQLTSEFNSETALLNYIQKLQNLLASKGYPVAAVDSFWTDTR